MKAIIIGATGLIGKKLVVDFLDKGMAVVIFVRTRPEITHPNLEIHQVDFNQIDQWAQLIQGDVLCSCLGTTLKKAKSKKNQYKIDYTYQYQVAQAASLNGVKKYILISSIGADPEASTFYLQIKGKLEKDLKELIFESTFVLRPSFLDGERSEVRIGEKIGLRFFRLLNYLPFVAKYAPITDKQVSACVMNLLNQKTVGYQIIENEKMKNPSIDRV